MKWSYIALEIRLLQEIREKKNFIFLKNIQHLLKIVLVSLHIFYFNNNNNNKAFIMYKDFYMAYNNNVIRKNERLIII